MSKFTAGGDKMQTIQASGDATGEQNLYPEPKAVQFRTIEAGKGLPPLRHEKHISNSVI